MNEAVVHPNQDLPGVPEHYGRVIDTDPSQFRPIPPFQMSQGPKRTILRGESNTGAREAWDELTMPLEVVPATSEPTMRRDEVSFIHTVPQATPQPPFPLHPSGRNEAGRDQSGPYGDGPTMPLRVVPATSELTMRLRVVSPEVQEQQRGKLREIPQFIVYLGGAVVVVGLYLVIPLMLLLNVILPENWNRLFIALGILGIGELAICAILFRTTPKEKGRGPA